MKFKERLWIHDRIYDFKSISWKYDFNFFIMMVSLNWNFLFDKVKIMKSE